MVGQAAVTVTIPPRRGIIAVPSNTARYRCGESEVTRFQKV
jgi:hypothetical protein